MKRPALQIESSPFQNTNLILLFFCAFGSTPYYIQIHYTQINADPDPESLSDLLVSGENLLLEVAQVTMEADHEIRIVALNVLQVLVNVAEGPEHEIIQGQVSKRGRRRGDGWLQKVGRWVAKLGS